MLAKQAKLKKVMITIKKTGLAIGMITLCMSAIAQNKDNSSQLKQDSVNFQKRAVAFVADQFAVSRPLNIEYNNTGAHSFKSKRGETPLPDGRVNSFQQVKASANINFIKKQTWILGTTIGYKFTAAETSVNESVATDFQLANNFHYLFSSLNLSYFSMLLGKRTVYTTSFLSDGSEKHVERIKGIAAATMVLKANKKTKMTAGIVLNIDPSSQSLILPTFSYEHKFDNGLIADIVLPRSIYIRKFVFDRNGRVSLGTQLDQTSFYLYNLDGTNQRYEYRQLDINSGITYEHVIAKYFLLTAKSGIKLTPSGRIFKKEESFADPVYKISPDPAFYFNIGISFNPFSVFGKR